MFSSEFKIPTASDVEAYPVFVSTTVRIPPPPSFAAGRWSEEDGGFGEKDGVAYPLSPYPLSPSPSPSSSSSSSPEPSPQKYDTLAELFFKFGFLFPILWLAGAFILRIPLTIDPNIPCHWMTNKTDGEKAAFLRGMRETEILWARRCLKAWCIFTFLVVVVVVVILCAVLLRRT